MVSVDAEFPVQQVAAKQAAQVQRDQSACVLRLTSHDRELSLIRQRLWQIERDLAEEHRRSMLQSAVEGLGVCAPSESSRNAVATRPTCCSSAGPAVTLLGR